ncbi:MAG: cohesin domain-containing protein [Bacteroidota bacterium]
MNKPFTPLQNKARKATSAKAIPVTAGSATGIVWKTVILTIFLLGLLLSFNTAYAQNVYCTMVCNDNLNISIGNQCSVTVRYDMILEDGDNSYSCTPNGWQAFKIEVMDENQKVIPTSPTIPYEYVGRTLTVKVKHWATGNNCWSTITLQDKIAPRLNCPGPISIPCTQSTDPSVTGQATVTDCGSGSSVTYEDVFTDLDCGNPIGKITRIWTAEDAHGNKSQCSQIINITRPDINMVLFPQNRDGITKPALSCVEVSNNSNKTSPEFTGYPTINGQPITSISGDVCKLNADFEDRIVDACNGSYKIIRTWSVLNWCTSDLKKAVQIIKVEDKTPPTITVPADITVGTQTIDCFANVPLLPATVADACSNEINVRITSKFNTINANGGTLLNVPVGTHTIVYEAVDACGNTASKPMRLTVVDDDPPVMVCNDETVVSLTSDGTATVFAAKFDAGSYDNCCLSKFLVRRMGDSEFGLSVKFECTDDEVMVELQATDCNGNANSCMVRVSIQDKVEPTIVCPSDRTIDCEADYSDLSQFGQPQIVDNCGFEIVETVAEDLDNCGTGTIKRTWTAMGSGGGVTACTQTITIINATPWNANNNQITWPKDYETSECITATSLDPEDLPEGFNKPTFIGDNGCALIATNHDDVVLDIEPPACFKILRKWTVIDWCQYDVNSVSSAGRYEFEQVIKVNDNTAPAFGVEPTDFTVDMLDDNCGGTVTIPNVGVSDCSPNAMVTAQGALGSGFGPFTNVMPGVYPTKYLATDGCGNTTTKDVTITVRDAKKPTPICMDGLAITLMAGTATTPPMVELWAKDLDAKSFDNCTNEANLDFRIRKYTPGSTNAPGTTNITFTCDDLGTQQVEVWVLDANGNMDFCITTVEIQDNAQVCGDSSGVDAGGQTALSGKITTEMGNPVSDVSVQITHPDKAPYLTGNDGQFSYEQLPGNLDYALIPEKKMAPKNGVSTLDIIKMRKHIINLEVFDSPYKMIAADVNQSGTISTMDLIHTRKLILGLIDEFPNNESWRFVPVAHEFTANANPLQSDFPEIAVIPSEATNKTQIDFVGIKIGDVDNSGQSNGWMSSESRSGNETMLLDIEDQQFEAGEMVTVSLKANQFTNILGYQFELNFDVQKMEYQIFKEGEIRNLTASNLALQDAKNGVVKVSWDDVQAAYLADGETVMTFQFVAKTAGQLSEVFGFSQRGLTAQAYTDSDETYDLALNFNTVTETVTTAKLSLDQNQPNPFSEQTTIRFALPTAQEATLTVFDVHGKVLQRIAGHYAAGTHAVLLDKADLPTVGLLYYALETANERLVKKMIVLSK